MPPAGISKPLLGSLGRLFAGFAAFEFTLDRVGWFGEEVVWLGPRDPAPESVGSHAHERYRLAPEEAKAFLTAVDSFAQPHDKDPSSQAERSMTGLFIGSGTFGVRTNGGPISC